MNTCHPTTSRFVGFGAEQHKHKWDHKKDASDDKDDDDVDA
jgi:hypothetical protein